MKSISLSLCLLLAWKIALVQVSGKVLDADDHAPIPSATVFLNGTGKGMATDSGTFIFRNLKGGPYTLRVSSIGYTTFDTVIAAGTGPVEIYLNRLNLFLQPVEVKAIRAGDNAPFTKTNITKAQIEKANLGQDLPFLLNQTPSVVVNSDAGNGVGYTAIRIRGSDATRINVTLNGIPYNDAESQGTFFVDLPDIASSVSSLQIQRGVGTSSNGGGAFGATINLSTNEAITEPYAEINNSYGSFNTWKNTLKVGTGLVGNHFTVDARVSHLSGDGFIDRAFSNLRSIYLSAAYLAGKTAIRFNVISGKEKTYQAWYGVAEADLADHRTINYAGTEKPGDPYANETDNYKQDHYQLFFNRSAGKHIELNTALFLTTGAGYFEEYRAAQAYADYGLPDVIHGTDTSRATDLVRQLWLDNRFYGQIFSAQYKNKAHQVTIGGGWNHYAGAHFGEVIWAAAGIPNNYRWYDHDAAKTDVNLYSKYEILLGKYVHAFADLQFRRVRHTINGFEHNPLLDINKTYNFFNPKAGISGRAGNYRWYASYSIGQREPNRDDFEAGRDQQARPEKMQDIEAGLERRASKGSWGATLYYMKYKDQLVLTGKINDVGAYTRTNIPDSYRFGVELQGAANIAPWLNISGNLTISRNKLHNFTEYYDDYDEGGQKSVFHPVADISFSPPVTGAATLNVQPVKDLQLSLLAKYVGRQYLDNTSNKSRSLAAYYVQDARLTYTIMRFFKSLDIIVQVNNVWDKKYEPNGYTYSYLLGGAVVTSNYYFPMAGRNFQAALNIKL